MTDKTNNLVKKRHPVLTLLGVLAGLVCVVLVAAVIFPSPILRHIFSRVEAQSGIALTFDRAYFYIHEGSFFSIDGLSIQWQNHHASNFDLRAESVRMPAMVPNDFRFPVLLVTGLRGTYERVGSSGGSDSAAGKDAMNIHALMLADAEVDFIDLTPEVPFRTTIQIKEFYAANTKVPSLFEPYTCLGFGQLSAANFGIDYSAENAGKIEIAEVPLGLLVPYVPALDDIFNSGSITLRIDDLTDEMQKKVRIAVRLLPDCAVKSADDILAPAIRAALQTLDQSSLPALHDLKGKIDRLKTSSEAIRAELDSVTRILDTLKALAPRDVREKYENFKNRYDRAKGDYEEWDAKFEILLQDLDRVKAGIVEDTFRHFIASGVPIEMELHEVNGEWQYDPYETILRLVEQNYQTIINTEYQKRILELRDAVDRLLKP